MKTTPTQARLAEQLSVPLYDEAMLNAVAAESHTRALTHADLEMGADKLEVIALPEPFLGRNLLSLETFEISPVSLGFTLIWVPKALSCIRMRGSSVTPFGSFRPRSS